MALPHAMSDVDEIEMRVDLDNVDRSEIPESANARDVDGVIAPEHDGSMVALDDALVAFAQVAPRQAKVVELRFFGGLTEEEIVDVLKVSPRTVQRDWEFARVWLARELRA